MRTYVRDYPLCAREFEALRLGIDMTLEGVAHEMGITRSTVANHYNHAYEKLDVQTRSEAVAYLDDHHPGWRPRRPFHPQPSTAQGRVAAELGPVRLS